MTHRIELFQDIGLAYVRYFGDISLQELRALMTEINGRDDWQGITRVVADHRFATLRMSSEEVTLHARTTPELQDEMALDLVVSIHPSDLGYGLARMFQAVSRDRMDTVYHPVRTPEAAIEFLAAADPPITGEALARVRRAVDAD